jgi:hypothetical protein
VHLSDVQEYLMTLRVAVQMDPIAGINIAGDSTFALMLSAQARGHTMWYYDVGSLAWEALGDGPARVTAAPVTVRRPAEGETHYELGAFQVLDLVEDVDVVLMRQDPPFDLGYITGAHILEKLKGRTLVVNDPEQVRNAPEKVFVLDFAQFMPPRWSRGGSRMCAGSRSGWSRQVTPAIWLSSRSTAMAAKRCSAFPPAATIWALWSRCSVRCGPSPIWSSLSCPTWPRGQAHRAGRWRGGGRHQPPPGRWRVPQQSGRGWQCGGDRTDAA